MTISWVEIFFGALLTAIVLAFIFSGRFRQDVIGGNGTAKIFGILTIEGVTIVILCLIFVGAIIWLRSHTDESYKAEIDGFIEELHAELKGENLRIVKNNIDVLITENQKIKQHLSQINAIEKISIEEYIEVYFNLNVTFIDSTVTPPENRTVRTLNHNNDWAFSRHADRFRELYSKLPFEIKPHADIGQPSTKIYSNDMDSSATFGLVSGWIEPLPFNEKKTDFIYFIRLRSARFNYTNREGKNHANYQIIKIRNELPELRP
ncbi:MAG: hypothetical protein ED557_14880 [Balneola sp.]|nr:MAG: hypothetical protein ED557_14880 [Balneola sp.]